MASCPHISIGNLKTPSSSNLHKEECTLCFDSQDLAPGIDVCLTCFNAGCNSSDRHHAQNHYQKTSHPLVLNIYRVLKDKPKRADKEPPQKISKLAIVPESDEDKYDFVTRAKCYACGGVEIDKNLGNLSIVIDSVMTSLSASKQSEIKAWEEEITACDHARNLEQDSPRKLESQALAHCNDCDLKENLWLCLVCGNLGCGRQQFGGASGNGHGLAHFDKTKHPISCKLGTITPEGTADIYCYLCNDSKLDPALGKHLANFGINVESQHKTEKNITELQLEQNLKFDFSMVTEDGKELEPLFGSGYTGIKNLGNSCYMASVLQAIFSLDAFQQRYYPTAMEHHLQCSQEPAKCLQCQLSKLADGLLSGRYSKPITQTDESGNENRRQDGITPAMFKALIGEDHKEFATMRQQDAFEFFQHLITTIERKERTNPENDPTKIFKFTTQQRLQCLECKRVRYSNNNVSNISIPVPAHKIKSAEEGSEDKYEPVTFEQCLESFTTDSMIEYSCPACKKKTPAVTNVRFVTFPEVFIVQTGRFEMDWVLRKISVPVLFDKETLNFDKYIAHGKQESEVLLPEEKSTDASEPAIDQTALNLLLANGCSEIRSKKALIATGNNAEMAQYWLFEHMDDPDIDMPISSSSITDMSGPSEADITSLTDMGFTRNRAKKALGETNNNVERAVEWHFNHPEEESSTFGDSILPANYRLQSVISHKGTSLHCGHYVAHVYKDKDQRWVLYNDNKVVNAPRPPLEEAYIYILRRI